MPVYRVKMTLRNGDGSLREVTTNFAGCRDQAHAKEKARTFYDVTVIHWVKTEEPEPKKMEVLPKGGPEM